MVPLKLVLTTFKTGEKCWPVMFYSKISTERLRISIFVEQKVLKITFLRKLGSK